MSCVHGDGFQHQEAGLGKTLNLLTLRWGETSVPESGNSTSGSVVMVTASLNRSCLLSGFLSQTLSFPQISSLLLSLKQLLHMGCSFLVKSLKAELICIPLSRDWILRPRWDVLSFSDDYLMERYCFPSHTIIYLNIILIHHNISNITHYGNALRSEPILCIALHLFVFANGCFLYNSGDAEHTRKATVWGAGRKVSLAFKRLLHFCVGTNLKAPSKRDFTGLLVTYVESIQFKWMMIF